MSTLEVTERIEASPEQVGPLVGSPIEMSGPASECIEMQRLGRSSGPAVGARFRGRNRSDMAATMARVKARAEA